MKNYLRLFTVFALAILATALPEIASAGDSLGVRICKVYHCYVSSDLMIIIATVAIFFLGIGAFFGKVNWGLVIIVVLGVVVITGAMQIGSAIAKGTGTDNCTSAGALSGADC